MTVLYLVLPLALVLGALFVAAFLWAARQGQFDDLETPAYRAILDDGPARPRSPDGAERPVPAPGLPNESQP